MRRLLIILFLICGLAANAERWYVHPGGSDTDGDGSAIWPWLTYDHAADTITGLNFIGDTIFLDVGTFTVTGQISHTVGISVMGVEYGTIITAESGLNPLLYWIVRPKERMVINLFHT